MANLISKIKNSSASTSLSLENNPIENYFMVGKESCCAGPGLVWRIYDAIRKSDKLECSVFILDKRIVDKLYRPKTKESMLERIKACIITLHQMRNPRMLQIIHTVEEGRHTLAFASESVYGSLHNILAWHASSPIPRGGQMPVMPHPISLGPPTAEMPPPESLPPSERPPFAKEYEFLNLELRYGFLQIIEALYFMHYHLREVHRNICPETIIVTTRGTWKLFGLEFSEKIIGSQPTEMVKVQPWSVKVAKLCQPNLDYLAPEVQLGGHCNILSDMFSFGLVICAIFNRGKSLLKANNNPMLYLKQIEFLPKQVKTVLERVPHDLQEPVKRLLSHDPHPRPTSEMLPLIGFFKCQGDKVIQAMQHLDIINLMNATHKRHYYRDHLIKVLPLIPKKLRWQLILPALKIELSVAEVSSAALVPIIWMTSDATEEEFTTYILPALQLANFKELMKTPKTYEPAITLLENMHILISKCRKEDRSKDILPVLYAGMDNDSCSIQTACLMSIKDTSAFVSDKELQNIFIHKVRLVVERNQNDDKIVNLTLGFFESVLFRLNRNSVLEEVIPSLLVMQINDADTVTRAVKLYKSMLTEKKFGLTTNVMATKMIPSLAPQTVNPALNLEQFSNVMEVISKMVDYIDKQQRNKLKEAEAILPNPERRALRHQQSQDNMAPTVPFNIPNLRVEQRKTSSAGNMNRKNSVAAPKTTTTAASATATAAASTAASAAGSNDGSTTGNVGGLRGTGIAQWIFGSNNSTNNEGNSNFLRVASVLPNRRSSDNTMMTPKIRIATSCASSPGGSPGGTSGLPARRHSSIGPQERRGSAVNLSPPTVRQYRGRGGSGSSLSVPSTSRCVGGSMPNTSSSVPFLLTSSMQSVRSRRPSACPSGSQGSGILQQISNGVTSSMQSVRSRRPSACPSGSQGSGILQQIRNGVTSSMQSVRSRRPSACPSGSQGSGILQQISNGVHQLFSGRT